jgi:hypothetical protein
MGICVNAAPPKLNYIRSIRNSFFLGCWAGPHLLIYPFTHLLDFFGLWSSAAVRGQWSAVIFFLILDSCFLILISSHSIPAFNNLMALDFPCSPTSITGPTHDGQPAAQRHDSISCFAAMSRARCIP